MSEFEKEAQASFERQMEVLDAIKLRKGDEYAKYVAMTASTLSLIWSIKGKSQADVLDLLDWAAECVLMVGAGRVVSVDALAAVDSSVAHLREFTADVSAVSRHQVVGSVTETGE